MYNEPAVCHSWDFRCQEGWYLGTSLEYYHCHRILTADTLRPQIFDTITFHTILPNRIYCNVVGRSFPFILGLNLSRLSMFLILRLKAIVMDGTLFEKLEVPRKLQGKSQCV